MKAKIPRKPLTLMLSPIDIALLQPLYNSASKRVSFSSFLAQIVEQQIIRWASEYKEKEAYFARPPSPAPLATSPLSIPLSDLEYTLLEHLRPDLKTLLATYCDQIR